jgi:hypothetical protein
VAVRFIGGGNRSTRRKPPTNAGRKFLKISNVKTSKIRFAIKIQNLGFGPILTPIVLVIAI